MGEQHLDLLAIAACQFKGGLEHRLVVVRNVSVLDGSLDAPNDMTRCAGYLPSRCGAAQRR